jgi:hypothetical protein
VEEVCRTRRSIADGQKVGHHSVFLKPYQRAGRAVLPVGLLRVDGFRQRQDEARSTLSRVMEISLLAARKTGQRYLLGQVEGVDGQTVSSRPHIHRCQHDHRQAAAVAPAHELDIPVGPLVADPVEGPKRWTLTMTRGISLPMAKEICSL